MEALSSLLDGFSTALAPNNLLYCFIGVVVGNLFGVLPGLGALTAISILLPLTFSLPAPAALMMLAGIYYGTQYGGSITSILLNLPGTAPTAVTCLDGHPLAKQGKAGPALFMAVFASFIGASFGIVLMIFFSPAIVAVALEFGPAEFFSIMVLGLLAATTLARGSAVKGAIMVAVGVILGLVGIDVNSGTPRFDFNIIELTDGLNIVAIAMGLFGVAEVLRNMAHPGAVIVGRTAVDAKAVRPSAGDLKRSWKPILRGTGLGALLGILPGTGPTVASFMSYAFEKKMSRTPERFGTGMIEGVAGPEGSNNAAAQTAFIPTLTLGVPGDTVMALMLGALMIQGIQPGPGLMTEHADVFWGLIASFWIGNLLLVVLNVPLIGIWVRLLTVPYRIVFPTVLFFICIGVYSIHNSLFDVGVALAFGLAGFALMKFGFEPAPMLLGFILGPMMEEHLRRALLLSHGELNVLIERPISGTLLLIAALLVVWAAVSHYAKQRRAKARAASVSVP